MGVASGIVFLGLGLASFILTIKLIQTLGETGPESLKETLARLRTEFPREGTDKGVTIERDCLIATVVLEGVALLVDFLTVIQQSCATNDPVFGANLYLRFADWKEPWLQYGVQAWRLVLLGSIWNKCVFYGLFCSSGRDVLRWQDVLPSYLELIKGGGDTGLPGLPSALSPSGALVTCAFQEVSRKIRKTLLSSFVTFFLALPCSYVGCFWNQDGIDFSESKWWYFYYGLISLWGLIWALIANFLINIKIMLSLAAVISVQAFYMGTGKKGPLIVGILSYLGSAGMAFGLWTAMQVTLAARMATVHLISYEPYNQHRLTVDLSGMTIHGILGIVLFSICSDPLQETQVLRWDLGVSIVWLAASTLLFCLPEYIVALPSACLVGPLMGFVKVVAEREEGRALQQQLAVEKGVDCGAVDLPTLPRCGPEPARVPPQPQASF